MLTTPTAGTAGRTSDYPLNPLQPWIRTYQPATGRFAAQQAQTFKLDWMFWRFFFAKPGPPGVSKIGDIVIQRQPSAHSVDYQIIQIRDQRVMTAKIRCRADPYESVQSWALDESYPKPTWFKEAGEKFSAQTTGRVKAGKAYLMRYNREIIVPLDGPLICSWSLMVNPGIVKQLAASGKPFTLADQMSVLQSSHRSHSDIEVSVPNFARYATYRITGHGSPPIHVVVNPDIGAIFTTIYFTSAALSSIENDA